MSIFDIFSIFLLIAIAAYYFFYLRRSVAFWGAPTQKPWLWIPLIVLSLGIAALLTNMWALPALIVLHIVAAGVLMDFLHLILHRPLRNTVWVKVYRCGFVPLIVTAIVLTAGYFNMTNIHRMDYTYSTGKLTQNCRVIFVSDLHFGTAMDAEKLQAVCGELSALDADILILGGDLVDENTTREELQDCFAVLGGVETTHGVYFVYGNHDKSVYTDTPNYTIDELQSAVTDSGIQILRDESVDIGENLTLIGRDDASNSLSGTRRPLRELLAGTEETRFRLLIDHQPLEGEAAGESGCDLMLSGHTHNGQIWPIAAVNAMLGPVYGEYTFDDMTLVVSSGICGWGYPIRTQGQSEYVVIDLQAA